MYNTFNSCKCISYLSVFQVEEFSWSEFAADEEAVEEEWDLAV